MRQLVGLALVGLASCAQDHPTGPLAAYQQCVGKIEEQSDNDIPLTFAQAASKIQPCDGLLRQAAIELTRHQLGQEYNLNSAQTTKVYLENEQLLLETAACSLPGTDGPPCIMRM